MELKTISPQAQADLKTLSNLFVECVQALKANGVFHTPIALRRKRPDTEWNEYEMDAINRTKTALAKASSFARSIELRMLDEADINHDDN